MRLVMSPVWAPQSFESADARRAFVVWLTSPRREIDECALDAHVSAGTLQRWRRLHRWDDRALIYDRTATPEQRAAVEREREQEREEREAQRAALRTAREGISREWARWSTDTENPYGSPPPGRLRELAQATLAVFAEARAVADAPGPSDDGFDASALSEEELHAYAALRRKGER